MDDISTLFKGFIIAQSTGMISLIGYAIKQWSRINILERDVQHLIHKSKKQSDRYEKMLNLLITIDKRLSRMEDNKEKE